MDYTIIVLVLFMLFLARESTQHESFLGGPSFVGSSPPTYANNNRSNDYYFDRTGRKSSMFRRLPSAPTWELPPAKECSIDYEKTIHSMELYPSKFYMEPVSPYNPEEVAVVEAEPAGPPNLLDIYQNIGQGYLIQNKCGNTIAPCDGILTRPN
jgi:hypothetical protein